MRAAQTRVRIKGTRLYLAQSDYRAAGSGRRTLGWRVSGAGPNAVLENSLPTLINLSRDAARQSLYAGAAVETIVANIVGTHIKPQSLARNKRLRAAIHELWADWTDEADADGRLDFYGQQALAVRSVVTAGEVFVRLRTRRREDGLTVPLQLQVLESEHCPVEMNRTEPGGNLVRNGVEFDALGRRVAYWLYRQHPNDTNLGVVSTEPVRVPADEVLHLYLPVRPGQIRGEPWLARTLVKLKEIDAYDDAEVVRKKTAAMFAAFIRRPDSQGKFLADEDDPDTGGAALGALEPGTMQVLLPGEEVEFSEPSDVGGAYEQFMRLQARMIATSLGILYEQLTGDYSTVNDRTLRAALIEFRRRCAMWQHHLVAFGLCRPIWRRWLDLAAFTGALERPKRISDRDFYRVKWVPQAWPYLHPVQDVEAQVKEIRAGLASRSEKVSERGYDAETIDAEQAADNSRADALGVSYDSDGRKKAAGGSGGPSQDNAAPEDDEKPGAPAP